VFALSSGSFPSCLAAGYALCPPKLTITADSTCQAVLRSMPRIPKALVLFDWGECGWSSTSAIRGTSAGATADLWVAVSLRTTYCCWLHGVCMLHACLSMQMLYACLNAFAACMHGRCPCRHVLCMLLHEAACSLALQNPQHGMAANNIHTFHQVAHGVACALYKNVLCALNAAAQHGIYTGWSQRAMAGAA
jgi:hypothetical protein